MSDWHYMRLTGKKGDSGSELLAMYSASGLGNPTTQPDLWHTNFNSEIDFFLCTKVNDEEHSWGDVVKIRGEQLETYYSATGNGNPDTQSGAWHLPPAVGTDNFIIQKMETGTWGAAIRIRGINGENAVKITALSPADPSGTFSGQVGNYNGVLYQWVDSAWERIDAVTQTELTTAKNAAIAAANGNVATYTPRYYGPFSSTSASGFPSTTHKGDAYLNTTDSKLYIMDSSSWVAQNAVDDTNRGMFQNALKDILNLSGVSGIAEQYGAAFVENLFADKATINELQSLSVLFKEYCGSIMSKNPQVGDTMIYMGKNPRLSSVTREFQFAISEYLGKVGQQEMWSDKLITKILATGLLALCVSGCVQATDGVYSGLENYWQETNYYDVSRPQSENFNIVTVVLKKENGAYLITTEGDLYETDDYENYTYVRQLPFRNYGAVNTYNKEIYIGSDTGVYKTTDMESFQKILETNTTVQNIYIWKNKGLLVVTEIDPKVHYSNNGLQWNTKNWNVDSQLHFNDRFCCANFSNQYYEYTEDFSQIYQKNNPCYEQNMGIVSVFEYDNSFLVLSSLKLYSISLDLEENTLIANNLDVQSRIRRYHKNGIYYCDGADLKKINLDGTVKIIHNYGSYDSLPQIKVYNDYIVHFSTNGKIYISYDEKTWKELSISKSYIESEYHTLAAIIESDSFFLCFTTEANIGENSYYHLYISRGREAGSGIIEESFGNEANYTRNSNGLITQWGKEDAVGAITPNSYTNIVINFPQAFKSSESYTLTFGVETSQPGEETYIVEKSASSATVRVYCRNSETIMPAPTLHWTAIGY